MSNIISETSKIGWRFDNTYSRLPRTMMSHLNPIPVKAPKAVIINYSLSKELGLDFSNTNNENLAMIFSGNLLPEGSAAIAQAYAGHQFGHFTTLGDGRAIVVGEHLSKNNKRYDIQFKGSGKTPYSRNGDGRAALGPMLREYIISEAMNSLNIPTTRSLAVVTTGEKIIRENELPGAILTRVAKSHIRVGTFQLLTARQDLKNLKVLLDYTINRHYPDLEKDEIPALSLLKTVMKKQIDLVVNWMRVGFIHGVMNTDNMTVSGETIDYGPCAFMDIYDPKTVFSSIDLHGRYAFNNQPIITQWNLLRFAECLLPFLNENKDKSIKIAEDTVNEFASIFKTNWLKMMCGKLGLFQTISGDENLINDLLTIMQKEKLDYTNTFKNLISDKNPKNKKLNDWCFKWKKRLDSNNKNSEESQNLMKKNNPKIIPRNHKVEEILKSANENDLKPLKNFIFALIDPYSDNNKNKEFETEPPKTNKKYITFCGT